MSLLPSALQQGWWPDNRVQIQSLTLTSWAYCGSSADAVAEAIDDEPDTPPITHAAATAGGEGRQGAHSIGDSCKTW